MLIRVKSDSKEFKIFENLRSINEDEIYRNKKIHPIGQGRNKRGFFRSIHFQVKLRFNPYLSLMMTNKVFSGDSDSEKYKILISAFDNVIGQQDVTKINKRLQKEDSIQVVLRWCQIIEGEDGKTYALESAIRGLISYISVDNKKVSDFDSQKDFKDFYKDRLSKDDDRDIMTSNINYKNFMVQLTAFVAQFKEVPGSTPICHLYRNYIDDNAYIKEIKNPMGSGVKAKIPEITMLSKWDSEVKEDSIKNHGYKGGR